MQFRQDGLQISRWSNGMPQRAPMPASERKDRQQGFKLSFKTDSTKGLNLIFNYIDADELTSAIDIYIPRNCKMSPLGKNQFQLEKTHIVLIGDMGTHAIQFEKLYERLKLPAGVLAMPDYQPHDTVRDMAMTMKQTIMNKLKSKEEFYILGLSFGAVVALEIASMLEDEGYEGVVYCINGSPDTVPKSVESILTDHLEDYNIGQHKEELIQNVVVKHMCKLIGGAESLPKIEEKLQTAVSWREKIDCCIRALPSSVCFSKQYASILIENAYGRICQARKYNSHELLSKPLKSQIVVLRSRDMRELGDLGLSKYSEKRPIIYQLVKDRANVLDDLRCANIVNKYLSKNIIKQYNDMNICTAYTRTANEFATEPYMPGTISEQRETI